MHGDDLARAVVAELGSHHKSGTEDPSALNLIDYRLRQLIAASLAQGAIRANEKPMDVAEIVDLYARIFVELFSKSEVQRAG